MPNLTYKQFLFVQFYEGNGTDAARKAGYEGSDAVLAQVASENLRKSDIKKAIEERVKPVVDLVIADRQSRQLFWTSIMNDTSLELKDRLKASELLAKVDGDFVIKEKSTNTISWEDVLNKAAALDVTKAEDDIVFVK